MIMELNLSGLPVWWDAQKMELLFGPEKRALEPAVRRLGEMRDVLYQEKRPGKKEDERALYFMYRDLNLPEHQVLFEEKGIRYDITVLVPGSIGAEYIKTAGHYHPLKPGAHCTYPEVMRCSTGGLITMQRPHHLKNLKKGLSR